MGMFVQRWVALYRTQTGPAAKIIVDTECKLPFGVDQDDIADDCTSIIGFVALPDDYEPSSVAIDDREIEVQLPEEAA